MYSIIQACRKWKHYILGKETIIHTNHKPLQFIQTHGNMQNDRHQKWSTYLQQFHLNIKYKTRISNHVVNCLSRPLVASLATMFHSCGHEASKWPQLYQQYPDFGIGMTVTNFHIQDGLLCHLGHLGVPTSERAKLIWKSHYSRMAGHFFMEKIVVVIQKHFYWPKI
jgi:hypothetical protein